MWPKVLSICRPPHLKDISVLGYLAVNSRLFSAIPGLGLNASQPRRNAVQSTSVKYGAQPQRQGSSRSQSAIVSVSKDSWRKFRHDPDRVLDPPVRRWLRLKDAHGMNWPPYDPLCFCHEPQGL